MRQSPPVPPDVPADTGLVLLVGFDPERPGDLSWPARAALSAADAVIHEGTIDPDILTLVPRRCFVESVPGDAARVGKLAGEGWRVVWLVAGDPSISLAALAKAERLAEAGIAIGTIASLPGGGRGDERPSASLDATLAPQSFATAFNGLAG
ncbi:MAG TPA: SAM-dependent methyltransferase [Stellaceae bacterium]|jgi:siroheme synthase